MRSSPDFMIRPLSIVAALALPALVEGQIRASEIVSISQTIDGTVISVEYSRPRARGRDPIFGTKAVRWDEVWTPGANWATTLDVSKAVEIEGRPVAKGKYSVWMVVRKDGPWTVVLEPKWHRYHMEPPDSSAAIVHGACSPLGVHTLTASGLALLSISL